MRLIGCPSAHNVAPGSKCQLRLHFQLIVLTVDRRLIHDQAMLHAVRRADDLFSDVRIVQALA